MVSQHGVMTKALLWWVACGVLILLLVTSAQPAAAWNSNIASNQGVCKWKIFAPQCQIPPGCSFKQGAPPVVSDDDSAGKVTVQASPVEFTQAALAAAQTLPSVDFARIMPLVQPVDRRTGQVIMTLMPATVGAQMRLQVNGGGVVTAMCADSSPIFVAFSSKTAAKMREMRGVHKARDEEEPGQQLKADGTDPIPRNKVFEVMQIQFYNGMLHEWPTKSTYPSATSLDIEIHLREAKVNFDMDGTLVYQSICTESQRTRHVTDYIISVPVESGATKLASPSILSMLMGNLTKITTQLSKGNSYEVDLGMTMPLISTPNAEDKVEFPFIYYVGSLAQPPCTPQVPRLQLLKSISMPLNSLTALKRISRVPNVNAGLRHPLQPNTTLFSSSVNIFNQIFKKPSDMEEDDEGGFTTNKPLSKEELRAKAEMKSVKLYRDAIPVLVTINIILLSYLLLLLFARLEWIDWPTALGGLNHPVQFYSRAYEELDALKAAGLRVAAAPAPDTQSNDAEENEEEEDGGGGGNNEGNEAGRAAANAGEQGKTR